MADILTLVQETLAGTELELVDVERAPLGLLRVVIDHPEGVRIEHCETVSKQLSRVFEVEDIDYNRLEVTSPGVDRPLLRIADFVRFAGQRVQVRLHEAVDNRKVFVGTLVAPEQVTALDVPTTSLFRLELDDVAGQLNELQFTYDQVDKAKLDPVLDFKGKKR
ncbi:ribosome maturation factor RimP [Alcaligenes endophyticus]|uniref:Ribosome maturation factor RimP n=1 Tax=Alcaligenes endophyticus TaxID=1929088 RepID=A0ABT8ENN1_9BURK|nr:ribosome maturation factor RimP [Alcaligenes endophyticus]MCX5591349.1 ribosome maturation factor RimP [Alcaligenes endophyticus]MDN4122770.1 ribosome maturation factor RimP [Alcaligenes endophyticus]